MNNREFEAFHYKDARPGGIALHNHDFFEVYLFLDGEVAYQIENALFSLRRGDVLLVSPRELHRPIVKKQHSVYERIVLWIDRHYLQLLKQDYALDFEQCFDPRRALHTSLIRLGEEQLCELTALSELVLREQNAPQYGSDVLRRCLLVQILTLLNRLTQQQASFGREFQSDPLVDQVFTFINSHIHESLTLNAIAATFYVDVGTLSRRFKRQLGTSIPEYVRQKRLTIARNMLLEGAKPTAIAVQCGYADYSSFFRAFRAQYGTSPRALQQSRSAAKTAAT